LTTRPFTRSLNDKKPVLREIGDGRECVPASSLSDFDEDFVGKPKSLTEDEQAFRTRIRFGVHNSHEFADINLATGLQI
jgi:hypothetical protein